MKDNKRWFEFYGLLDHIDKRKYLKGPYRYVCTFEAEDGGVYDIVRHKETDQEYWTEI